MAMVGAEMVVPLYIQNIRGESAFHSGLMLLPGALIMGAHDAYHWCNLR